MLRVSRIIIIFQFFYQGKNLVQFYIIHDVDCDDDHHHDHDGDSSGDDDNDDEDDDNNDNIDEM